MKRAISEVCVFVAVVLAGVEVRLVCEDVPNFAPVAALALWAGYFFRRAAVAAAVPFSVMLLSDWRLERFYDWPMMLTVYAALALPVLFRGWLRNQMRPDRESAWAGGLSVAGASLSSSIAFFVITNFGCWLWFPSYEPTWRGLVDCYVQGLPFFRYTLLGDASFAVVLFGASALACHWQNATVAERCPGNLV